MTPHPAAAISPGTRCGIADLDPDRARAACRAFGWSDARIAATRFTADAASAIGEDDVDVVVEATGDPAAGIAHARAAFAATQCCRKNVYAGLSVSTVYA